MNFSEGMRRLGLTAGVLGAVTVAILGYQPLVGDPMAAREEAREKATEFDSLMKLPITRKVAARIADEKLGSATNHLESGTGIIQIGVSDGQIISFLSEAGAFVTKTSPPSRLWYGLYPLALAVGFALPWGAVRLFSWIVSGFIGK